MVPMRLPICVAWVCSMLPLGFVHGDTFHLKSGGQIEGDWVNPRPFNSTPSTSGVQYIVETSAGIRITLNASDVAKVIRAGTTNSEFAKQSAEFPDTPDGQWRLAAWCLKMGMKPQRQAALKRIVQLEPHHAEARKALGHHWHQGRWTAPRQHRLDQGMVRHGGKWQYKQEIEFAAKQREAELAAKRWRKTLRQWRFRLESADRADGVAKIVAVRDPLAIPALLELLEGETVPQWRLRYVETIGKMNANAAVRALSRVAMESVLDDAYGEAIRVLRQRVTPDVVEHFVKQLTSNDNAKVNRAGMVLAELGDASAASPLIDALVTKHWRPRKNTVFAMRRPLVEPVQKLKIGGSDVPEYEFREVGGQDDGYWETRRNEEVLRALCSLVGDQGFGFREDSWRVWHNALLNIRRQQRLRRNQ